MCSVRVYGQNLASDSLVLLKLYNATNGSNWVKKTNWLSSSSISSWYGVTVKDLRVTSLRLSFNNLSGPIPVELGNIDRLKHLLLDNNNLSGSIPAELGNLSNLENLSLNRNKLDGSIPAEIGKT